MQNDFTRTMDGWQVKRDKKCSEKPFLICINLALFSREAPREHSQISFWHLTDILNVLNLKKLRMFVQLRLDSCMSKALPNNPVSTFRVLFVKVVAVCDL